MGNVSTPTTLSRFQGHTARRPGDKGPEVPYPGAEQTGRLGAAYLLGRAGLEEARSAQADPADPNEANEPNYPPFFRAGSCRKWITLDATRQLVHSMNPTAMVPVYIQVPQGLNMIV